MAFTYITGSGTQADPYVIIDKNGWNELASYVNAGNKMEGEYVELGADIDFQTTTENNESFGDYGSNSCSTIGGNNNALKTFQGTFDGNGHSLNRFYTSTNYGMFYTSGNVVIKNLKIINLTGSYSAIVYTNESVSNKTPLIENIVLSSFVTNGDYNGGSLLSLIKNSSYSSNLMTSVTFVIRKCFCYGVCGNYSYSTNNHAMIGMTYSVNNTNMMPNIQVSDCMLLNYIPINSWYSYNSNITFTNVIAYYFCDLTSNKKPYPSDYSLNSTNCYVVYHSEHSRIDEYFNLNWNRMTPEECLISSNFNGFDFIDTWKIDTSLGFPVPAFAYNKYIHIHATSRGNIYSYTYGLGINSSDFCYRYFGRYGLIEKGTDISFGVQLNAKDSNRLKNSNFVNIKNLTTGQTGEDYQLYSNIQTSLIYKYEITPCFGGDGTEGNPFLIKTYYDFRAILEYSSQLYYYCSYLSIGGDYLSGYYASIENDIEMNDVSNFNNWHNTAPTNQVSGQRTDVSINGNNHKIIGLYFYSKCSFFNSINNIKFDYLSGPICFGSTINDCEFNGRFYFSGTTATFSRCVINILPRNNNLKHYNNCLCYNSSSSSSNPTFINCIITVSTSSLRQEYARGTFTNCVLLGSYYRNAYLNRSNSYEYPTFNNTYIIDESVIVKDDIPGLTYITNNEYIRSTASLYNGFDFTNVFELYNKEIDANHHYITIPILKNMEPRFSFISILNDDYYGLESITNYYYMQKLPSYENTGANQISITVTPNSDSYFTKWNDTSSNVSTRVFDNYDDHYITYNLLPNCGNILSGKGTETEPYLITSKTDLVNIINWFNSLTNNQVKTNFINPCYFKITTDIEYQDCSNWELWENNDAPETFDPFHCFKGHIDGDNHTISGLYRSTVESNNTQYSSPAQYPSLFIHSNDTTSNAITDIRNLKIVKSVLKRRYLNYTYLYYLSFIKGRNCHLVNCNFSGIIISTQSTAYIAGMCVADQYLYAENCKSDIKITVSDSGYSNTYPDIISGMFIIVYNGYSYYEENSIIKKCVNKSQINCTNLTDNISKFIAGILATGGSDGSYSPVVDITESYNRGNITATNARVAGIACGNVTNGNSRATITDCYNIGDITTASKTSAGARGSAGIEYRLSRNITNCYNYGNIVDTEESSEYIFAISRFDSSTVHVEHCYYLENSATNSGGGIALTSENFSLPTALAGFDFINTWIIDYDAGRPKLIDNYETGQVSLTVFSNNENYGAVSGGGTYDAGAMVTVTATPYAGHSFVVWSDGVKINPRSLMLNTSTKIEALFKRGNEAWEFLDWFGLERFWTDAKIYFAGNIGASKIGYNNTNSSLQATNTQQAIDEVVTVITNERNITDNQIATLNTSIASERATTNNQIADVNTSIANERSTTDSQIATINETIQQIIDKIGGL